jgi:transposase
VKLDSIDVDAALRKVERLLEQERDLSPALKSAVELLLVIVALLANRLNLNSRNSSKPPSSDPNRKRKPKSKGNNRPGGQNGHLGTTLKPVDDPDEIEVLKIDTTTLPQGQYTEVGFETRQVIDIDICRFVTEYRAQVLEDQDGNRFVAEFPEQVSRPVQYGNSVKSHAVYLSQFQLLPYQRIQDYFGEQFQTPLSAGSLYNFNQEAFERLACFEDIARDQLAQSEVLHADETGINVNGKRLWLHSASNVAWTLFYPHPKRGTEAMEQMGVLPRFHGVLCHDHWKPYFTYDCTHALCNAHHLRELERAWEQDGQSWAAKMKDLLEEINGAVTDAGGLLPQTQAEKYRKRYRRLLREAENECPPPDESKRGARRGRLKRTKARNLLERLRNYEAEVLRFMEVENVPFTNNQGENDIRMTKVQQKISGCFRSMDGAMTFCRIRSYLSTCRKHKVSATQALRLLFEGKWPDFVNQVLAEGAE